MVPPSTSNPSATSQVHPWLQINEKPLPWTPRQVRANRYGLPASVFQIKDTRTATWKPWSLGPLFLGCLASTSLGALICIDLLRQRSNVNNGLAFYKTSDEVPTSTFIAYNYVPTVLATILGILWSIVDLDVRRLEPYNQISGTRHRAFPLTLLLLDYTYLAAWNVPFQACRKRHWTIMVTSSVFLITSVLLVPMQSAVFRLKSVSISSNITLDTWSDLPTPQRQSQLLTGEAVNQANSIITKNASLPPFTTREYAVGPLKLEGDKNGNNETWDALARVYWSEPTCFELSDFYTPQEPDQIYPWHELNPDMFVFVWNSSNASIPREASNSTSCHMASYSFALPDPLSTSYTRFEETNNTGSGVVLDPYKCIKFPFAVISYTVSPLYDSGNRSVINFNATAIAAICKSDYYSGTAKVSALKNGTIATVAILEDHEPKKLNAEWLNIDALEDSISNAYHVGQNVEHNIESNMTGKAPQIQDPAHTFVDYNTVEIGDVINASLGGPVQKDYPRFETAIKRTYKLISALAMATLLRSETDSGYLSESQTLNATTSVHRVNYIAIAVDSSFAVASEIILGLVAVAALFNYISYLRRNSFLRSDPDSLAAMFALVACHFSNMASLKALNTSIVTMSTQELQQVIAPFVCRPSRRASNLLFKVHQRKIRQDRKPTKPSSEQTLFQSLFGLIMMYGALCLTTVACVFLLTFMYLSHFTYLAKSDSLESQALWSFTPTLAATTIGAIWTVVHRDLTIFEPWASLRSAAPAITSLSVTYASRTPYSTMVKASMNRHFFLTFVSLICISTNVLNISMGGLFYQVSSVIKTSVDVTEIYDSSFLPTFWNSSDWNMADAFELVRANVSDNVSVPAWSLQDRFFLPVQLSTPDSRTSSSTFDISTTAVGASLQCTSAGQAQNSTNLTLFLDPTSYELDEGCFIDGTIEPTRPGTIFLPLATSDDNATDCGQCLSVLENILQNSASYQMLNTLYGILCWPQVQVHNARIAVDENGFVQAYELQSSTDELRSSFDDVKEHVRQFMENFSLGANPLSVIRKEDFYGKTKSYDWPGILTARIRSLTHPDGAQNADILAAAANQTFARTFASFWVLYSDQFLIKKSSTSKSRGTVSYQTARIMPSIPAFAVTISLLILNFIGATVVYFKRRKQLTPRIPYSIGTILPWIIHSRMLKDFAGTSHLSSSLRNDYLQSLGKKYQFGWFRDEQNIVRLGIEESKFIIKTWERHDAKKKERKKLVDSTT